MEERVTVGNQIVRSWKMARATGAYSKLQRILVLFTP